MKRILCAVISAFIFSNAFLVYSSASNQEMNVHEYNKLIRKLTDAYVPDNFVSTEEMTEYPLNRLIVKTASNEPLENDYGAADKIEGYNCLHILQYETEEETDEAYENLIHDNIEYVEYDYWLTIVDSLRHCYCEGGEAVDYLCSCTGYAFCPCEDPDATETHYSWNSGAVQVDEAFRLIDEYGINCEPIKVAVLDTGVYAAHSEFSKNGENANRIKADPDYVYIKNSIQYPSNEDDYFHGTHVAGIVHNNTMDNVEIYSYRMSGKTLSALSCSELTGAIDAAVTEGIDVINMSLRRSEFYNDRDNRMLEESLKNAVENNVVLVAGAGNGSDDADNFIPSKFDEVITVSATTRENKIDKSYSSYGSCVDIGAPGTDIRSTSPRNNDNEEPLSLMIRTSGTSMATPLVSAAVATLKSIDPNITPSQAKRLIKETAYVPEGWDYNYGAGIVNFYNLVRSVLEPEGSETPIIKLNSNDQFEIHQFALSNSTYYTLDGSEPTPEDGFVYSYPLDLSNKTVSLIKAASYKNGEQIGETAVYKMSSYETLKMNYKDTKHPISSTYTKKIRWSSSDPNIATVDSEGNIKAVGVGETQVTAKLSSGKRIIYNVKVEYSKLQWFIMVFLCGFLWYI